MPGAPSLTEMVTSVVSVLYQVICSAKLVSVSAGGVYRTVLWKEVLPGTTADNKGKKA